MIHCSPFLSVLFVLLCFSTNGQEKLDAVERLHEDIHLLVPKGAVLETLAEGFSWSEGPVWVEELNALLFTDVPNNKAYRWDVDKGLQTYLNPSGYTGYAPNEKKAGGNGLTLDTKGNLIIAQHGDRRIAKLNAPLDSTGSFITVVDRYEGKRFHSPNDLVFNQRGDLFFTDPPYGLNGDRDPLRELPNNGVYRINKNGEIALVFAELSRPNGLAFSADESVLYLANSDAKQNLWMAFDHKEGVLTNSRVFFDATTIKNPGLADGLKVHSTGAVFATGPGGVLVLSPEGKHLGTIRTPGPAANCAFDTNESYLYITANKYLTRIKLKN